MLDNYSNLTRRIISALIAIPIVVVAIYWSVWSYFLLFLLIKVLTLLEFYQIISLEGTVPLKLWGILSGILIYMLVFMCTQRLIPFRLLYILIPVIALTYFIQLYKKTDPAPFASIAYTLLGIIYVSVPFALLHLIAFFKGFYSYRIVLGILFILWANDIGAYVIGSSMGKHPLFKRISPQKTWEGILGGVILALLVSYGVAYYYTILCLWEWLGIAGITVVAGTYGDLVESLLKRSMNLKDSGTIIPGHGSFLDRFDSFLMAIPLILACIKLFA